MQNIQAALGRLLLIGVLVSLTFVILGGIYYLVLHGKQIVDYQIFRGEPEIYTSIFDIVADALNLAPRALIQLGLLILVFTQILRVGLTTWLFLNSGDRFFFYTSLFILLVLIYSLF